MSSILIVKDWDDCDMYFVIACPNPMIRLRLTEIIDTVKEKYPNDWDIEDIKNALCESNLDFDMYDNDIEEYYI